MTLLPFVHTMPSVLYNALEALLHLQICCGKTQPTVLLRSAFAWLQSMVAAWEASCGILDQYGMQYTRTFANLCNIGVTNQQLGKAACSSAPAADASLPGAQK